MTTGKCPHGEFDLAKGCSECIEERKRADYGGPAEPGPGAEGVDHSPEAHGIDPDYEAARDDQIAAAQLILSPDASEEAREAAAALEEITRGAIEVQPLVFPADAEWKEIKPLGPLIPETFETPPGFDLIRVGPDADDRVTALYLEGCSALAHAQARVIATNEDLKPATADLTTMAALKKALTERKEEYLKPVREFQRSFNDTFKAMIAPLEEADALTRQQMKDYRAKVQAAIDEAERIESEKLRLAREEAALKGGEITVNTDPVPAPAAAPDRVRAGLGMAGAVKVYRYEIIDFTLLPDEYKLPDAGKINRVVKASKGTIEIPGIRVIEDETIRVTR